MKSLLHFFAIVMVSSFAMAATAATNYGILVGGTWVTSDNASNVTGKYIKSGKVTYNSNSHKLTLTDVLIDCENEGGSSGINVQPSAPETVFIEFEGTNIIRNTNGVAFQVYNSERGYQQGEVTLCGSGSITIENGMIGCFNGVWLNLGDYDVMMGITKEVKPGCTINARGIYSRETTAGGLRIGPCNVNLSGFSYYSGGTVQGATVYGFNFIADAMKDCGIYLPSDNSKKLTYDTNKKYLTDADGNRVTGQVHLGWRLYGLRVGGVDVTAGNKDHIKGGQISGSKELSYSPTTNTLTCPNGLDIYMNDGPAIVNTSDDLIISCTGTYYTNIGSYNDAAITSTGNITFRGTADTRLQLQGKYIVKMDGAGKTAKFQTFKQANLFGNIDMNYGKLHFNACEETAYNLRQYTLQRMNVLTLEDMEITTSNVYYDPTKMDFYQKGQSSAYRGMVQFGMVTQNYGISVGGHQLNDRNSSNFCYYDVDGKVTFDNSSHTLTLDNVTVDCNKSHSAMSIGLSAGNYVSVSLVGQNTLKNIGGYVGVIVNNRSYIQGTGTLTVEGDIECFNGNNLTLRDGCTVKATRLLGRDGTGGGTLTLGRSTLELSGASGRYTLGGFTSVWTDSYFTTPNAAWYDSTDKMLKKFDGTTVTDRLVYEPVQTYGPVFNDIHVHDKNCDDILRDVPHTGSLRYDPDKKVMYMENLHFECDWKKKAEFLLRTFRDPLGNPTEQTLQLTGENQIDALLSLIIRPARTLITGPGSLAMNGTEVVVSEGDTDYEFPHLLTIENSSLKASFIHNQDVFNASLCISDATVELGENLIDEYGTDFTPISGFTAFMLKDVALKDWEGKEGHLFYDTFETLCLLDLYNDEKYYYPVTISPVNVTVEDITNLIAQYLDNNNGGRITVADITALINRYLEGTGKPQFYDSRAVDLGLSVKWASMNIGAFVPEDYGDYFAWGETTTKSTYDWSTYKWCNGSYNTMTKYCTDSSYGTVDNKTVLELSDDAANANWGGSWRMPTDVEWQELQTNCTWTWTTENGVNGYLAISKINGNSIFLPASGLISDGSFDLVGICGAYWSSSLYMSRNNIACAPYFDSDSSGVDSDSRDSRYDGLSVRAVCP